MKIGALWLKKTKEGRSYMSGVIEFPGVKIPFAVFKNEEKQQENHPDYNVIWNPPQEQSQKPTAAATNDRGRFDDDIPF